MSLPPEAQRTHGLEVADIFREYGELYRATYDPPLMHLKVMDAIVNCRTAALGGHLDECDLCGYQHPSYNSCRNRHCPKCGALARARWLATRVNELLPVKYFHVVMTLPEELNALAQVNPKVIYRILFRAGSETLMRLGKDPKHLGAEIGLLAALHTWGQNLLGHPHLHCIVTGGGLSKDGEQWVLPKKALKRKGKRKKFFIHVNVISDLFKKKFLAYLKAAYQAGELKFIGTTHRLESPGAFQELVDTLYAKKWVTYCKAPFGGPEQVLKYLARYTHRVAISNRRLLKLEEGEVYFKWRDYRDGKDKVMQVTALEFIRRFLLHVLPKRFYKIRYYGLLSNRHRKTKLARCREIFGVASAAEMTPPKSWEDLVFELTGKDPRLCPKCEKGHLVTKQIIAARCPGPERKATPVVVDASP